MKKTIVLFSLLVAFFTGFSIERDTTVFTGAALPGVNGDTLFFNQTFYVCGRTSSYYLYLSYDRKRDPEDVAEKGTAAYDSAVAEVNNGILKLYCPYVKQKDTIRLGSTVHNLVAFRAGDRYVKTYANSIEIRNNERPTHRPDVGDASLIVCAANVEHYCPDWEGSLSSAKSDTDYQRQHTKLMKALANIDADIFALTEIQPGRKAVQNVTNGLNEVTQPGLYAYVEDNDSVIVENVKVVFIYKTTKVRPVLELGFPYGTSYHELTYHSREEVQAFEELATGERFILSMNHFKAGAGDSSLLNSRLNNAKKLVAFLTSRLKSNYYNDRDVLVVGDLNSFMKEAPILYLEESGLENQLTRFAPSEYSYAMNNKVEYLDYAFTTPSLSKQVTGVMPYHVNTDESEIYYYANGEDTSMYRYSDHDPIIIGLRLDSKSEATPWPTGCVGYDYSESFENDFGSFYPISSEGSASWLWSSTYTCASINGVASNEVENDWLVSPYFNLTGADTALVSAEFMVAYGTDTLWNKQMQLFVSNDFRGDVETATWKQFPVKFPAKTFTWSVSETYLDADFLNKDSVVFAFRYRDSLSGAAPMWLVRNVTMTSNCKQEESAVEQPVDPENAAIYGIDGQIVIRAAEPAKISVYDLLGREVVPQQISADCRMSVPQGVYIVRFGALTKKVFVR